MQDDTQLVTIKGTNDGLTFYLADDEKFANVMQQLEAVLAADKITAEEKQAVPVVLKLGYRYVSKVQKQQLKAVIEQNDRFIIERFDSEVIGKQEAETWLERNEIHEIRQIVRSGQVIQVTGDLVLIGDVNPGGEVRATGNIYIMGKLYGIAHAGFDGDEDAAIAAAYMNPNQLRIAQFMSRAPDYDSEGVYMECGYLDKENNKIVIDRLQVLPYIQRNLRKFERGIQNG